MPFPRYTKDPEALLDYQVDWSDWLDDPVDTIATSVWTVPDGLTLTAQSHTTIVATVWLEGGTAGEDYNVENKITTVGGRRDERTITIKVKER